MALTGTYPALTIFRLKCQTAMAVQLASREPMTLHRVAQRIARTMPAPMTLTYNNKHGVIAHLEGTGTTTIPLRDAMLWRKGAKK